MAPTPTWLPTIAVRAGRTITTGTIPGLTPQRPATMAGMARIPWAPFVGKTTGVAPSATWIGCVKSWAKSWKSGAVHELHAVHVGALPTAWRPAKRRRSGTRRHGLEQFLGLSGPGGLRRAGAAVRFPGLAPGRNFRRSVGRQRAAQIAPPSAIPSPCTPRFSPPGRSTARRPGPISAAWDR